MLFFIIHVRHHQSIIEKILLVARVRGQRTKLSFSIFGLEFLGIRFLRAPLVLDTKNCYSPTMA